MGLTFRSNRVSLTKNFCSVSPNYSQTRMGIWFYLGSQIDMSYSWVSEQQFCFHSDINIKNSSKTRNTYWVPHMVLPCNGNTSVFVCQVLQSHSLSLGFCFLPSVGIYLLTLIPQVCFQSWLLISATALLVCRIFLSFSSLFPAASLPAWAVFHSLGFLPTLLWH